MVCLSMSGLLSGGLGQLWASELAHRVGQLVEIGQVLALLDGVEGVDDLGVLKTYWESR